MPRLKGSAVEDADLVITLTDALRAAHLPMRQADRQRANELTSPEAQLTYAHHAAPWIAWAVHHAVRVAGPARVAIVDLTAARALLDGLARIGATAAELTGERARAAALGSPVVAPCQARMHSASQLCGFADEVLQCWRDHELSLPNLTVTNIDVGPSIRSRTQTVGYRSSTFLM